MFVCVWLYVCGDGFGQVDWCIMGLCVWLCVLKPMLEVKGEREEKEQKKRNSKKKNKKEYLNKVTKKKEFGMLCVL